MYGRHLLIVTAAFEVGTGLLLLLLPAVPLMLLLGIALPGAEVALVSRVAGAALLAIGVSCWLARTDSQQPGAASDTDRRPDLRRYRRCGAGLCRVGLEPRRHRSMAGGRDPCRTCSLVSRRSCAATVQRMTVHPQRLRRPDEDQSHFRNGPDRCRSPGADRCTGVRSADHRRSGFAQRHCDDRRETTPPATDEIWRRDQGKRPGFQAVVAAARRAAQRRAQHPPHHDRRSGLRRVGYLRRRHPDARVGPHRQGGIALHAIPLHRPVLAHAGGADHRPQPSLGRAPA